LKLLTEGAEIAVVQITEMIGSPFSVTGIVFKLLNGFGRARRFTGPLAANDDVGPAEFQKYLRRLPRFGFGGDRGAEHFHVPRGRFFRRLADDMNVIEFKGGVAHGVPLEVFINDDTITRLTFGLPSVRNGGE
jgi:hypothetical protein